MNVIVTGKKMVDFVNDDGSKVQGISLYYFGKGQNIDGYGTNKIYIGKDSKIYDVIKKVNLSIPQYADFTYNVDPFRKSTYLENIEFIEAFTADIIL